MTCNAFKVGYAGQRYQVFAKNEDQKEFEVGWTNDRDGEPLVGMIKTHPSWHSPRVEDLSVTSNPYWKKP